MKKFLILLTVMATSYYANAQVLRAMTVRYNNPSVRGNIVQVANNIFTSVGGLGSSNPGQTSEAPPGGASRNNSTIGVNINNDALIPFGSTWKYLGAAASTPASWTTIGFNDAAWSSGAGELGYGDYDEATCVPSGGGGTVCVPTGTKVITTYFRKIFNITTPSAYTTFRFKVERDDGFVLYVNGTELHRNNMPTGTIAHTTVASADVNDAVITFTVPNTTFVSGNNIIAVEVHQRSSSSDDMTFDLELTGLTGTSDDIFNASTADLNLPSCSQVLFAGLYWGATQGTDGTNVSWITNENSIKLRLPGSSVYQNITSTQTDYHNGTNVPGLPHTGYRCFADITSLLNSTNPNGTYGIANMATPDGIANGAAGWTIIIAYANSATIVRNLTIFDGSVIINGGDPALHVPITGFQTPPSGPVSCELGAVVYDGDRTSLEYFGFKQNSNPLIGTYTDMTPNATSTLSDMWNSTISYKGANVTTRVPAHANTLGYDADIIDVPNTGNLVLGNNATSASLQFSSPSENYILHAVSTSISQYTPSFNLIKSAVDVNGGSLLPGDVVRYQIVYQNGGNDASTATTITDNIPAGTTYKRNSLIINAVSKTDGLANDEAEYDPINDRVVFRLGTGANGTVGGEVASGASGTVSFEVYMPSGCAVSSCGSTFSNSARISYAGKISLISLYDSSGVSVSGCNVLGPVTSTLSGGCTAIGDTILVNTCPSLTVTLPYVRYAGYDFYTALPFTSATRYDPATPVTFSRSFYAFYDGPGTCDDTLRVNVYITACPDIDDDNDGIPDYVEFYNPLALQDHDNDGILNWNDNNYPGFVDFNSDGVNDLFDPSADHDNDGTWNFYDVNFPGYVDTNGDLVNDNMDKDLDGIPNHLDLDSDNDGIPDTAESFGVDANGDGRIDNYTDTDNDGLSQNVDGSNTGVSNSGAGLGAVDTDGDLVPNFLDLDSDNDGIPDIVEVHGIDAGSNGLVDLFIDTDGDGLSDDVDSDVGNDAVAENTSGALLRTGGDANNNGRADSFPYKNIDGDTRPNPYDLDSDGDGITDVREAGFDDTDYNGIVDGPVNINGWNTVVAGAGSLGLPNTDGSQRENMYDIDSDNDGIPDNIEGMATNSYQLPSGLDADGDGIDNTYDNISGFGGMGVNVVDKDGDSVPDYLDLDTDSDGLPDIIEGNDLNLNGYPDDNIALTGIDTDGDGLDDFFDNNNSNAEGTSAYMGYLGSLSGDATPGSITTVQRTWIAANLGCGTERDWRCLDYTLSCDIVTFKGLLQGSRVNLEWSVKCRQDVDRFIIERSTDRINFSSVQSVAGRPSVNEVENYNSTDDINGLNADIFYYRLKTVSRSGRETISEIVPIRMVSKGDVVIAPNPVKDIMYVSVRVERSVNAVISIVDLNGKIVYSGTERLISGTNNVAIQQTRQIPSGIYMLEVKMEGLKLVRKFVKAN